MTREDAAPSRPTKARWEADPVDEAREPVLRGSRRDAVAYLVGEG